MGRKLVYTYTRSTQSATLPRNLSYYDGTNICLFNAGWWRYINSNWTDRNQYNIFKAPAYGVTEWCNNHRLTGHYITATADGVPGALAITGAHAIFDDYDYGPNGELMVKQPEVACLKSYDKYNFKFRGDSDYNYKLTVTYPSAAPIYDYTIGQTGHIIDTLTFAKYYESSLESTDIPYNEYITWLRVLPFNESKVYDFLELSRVPSPIDITYKVYVTDNNELYNTLGTVEHYEVWCEPIDTIVNGTHYRLAKKLIYETDNVYDAKLVYFRQNFTDSNPWVMATDNVPSDLFTDPEGSIKYIVDIYRNSSSTPSTTKSTDGTKVWINVRDLSSIGSYEYVDYTASCDSATVTKYSDGWFYIDIAPETVYHIEVTAQRYYHSIPRNTVTWSTEFSTLTALMYIDTNGNIGIASAPEDNTFTCSAFNLYEPNYNDDTEFPLFCIRESETIRNTFNHHTLLFQQTSPTVEDGDNVTITGKFTLIQWLVDQPPQAMKMDDYHPSVSCFASDGSGVLWELPSTLDWTVFAAPMGVDHEGTSVRYIVRLEWSVTTSITINTLAQQDKEFEYSVTYVNPITAVPSSVPSAVISQGGFKNGTQSLYTPEGFERGKLNHLSPNNTRETGQFMYRFYGRNQVEKIGISISNNVNPVYTTVYEHSSSYDTAVEEYEPGRGLRNRPAPSSDDDTYYEFNGYTEDTYQPTNTAKIANSYWTPFSSWEGYYSNAALINQTPEQWMEANGVDTGIILEADEWWTPSYWNK